MAKAGQPLHRMHAHNRIFNHNVAEASAKERPLHYVHSVIHHAPCDSTQRIWWRIIEEKKESIHIYTYNIEEENIMCSA